MASVASIKDYTGRTVDISAYQGVQPTGDVQLSATLALPGEGGRIVTGPQKVAQRFLLELLKETGTMKFRPNEGTTFLTEARIGAFQTQTDVFGAFRRGVAVVRPLLRRQELAADPDDERFVDAEVISISVIPGEAVITAELITRAGRDRTYIFPLNVPI